MKNLTLPILFSISCICLFSTCKKEFIEDSKNCVYDRTTVNESHPKRIAIQEEIDIFVNKGLPGMSILISDDDGVWIGTGGYADLENRREMEPCHLLKLGSITKMMMGALVWQLIQDGDLAIDDPISKHIPDVANRIENGNAITLAMLLNHTSGVYDIAGDLSYNLAVINDFTRSWTSEEILKFIEGKPATGLPGAELKYSNSNTMLTGLIITAVSGKPHGQLLKERIFDPLQMDNTVYYDYSSDFPKEYLAQGYLDFHNDGRSIQNISALNPGSGNGYTGVYSNVTDLLIFMNALLRDKTLTTPENLDKIFDSMVLRPGQNWRSSIGAIHDENMDLFDEPVHAYGHAGGDVGYSANLNYFPHNNTIFAATYNYGTNLPSDLGEELSTLRKRLMEIMAE